MDPMEAYDPCAPGEINSENLIFMPLGSGQEVGRSCHVLQFKGKRVMFDCGIHPGMNGVDALPFVDTIDLEKLDVLLVTHYHLDHCGALPWLLTHTKFNGRVFMTYATKSIFRLMISDYIKVAKFSGGEARMLYNEEDLERCIERIEAIDFKVQVDLGGLKFSAYVAGHVLGACMFLVEIGGSNFLYTGDFSRLEDRHLCAAEIPPVRPDIVISESTYGMQHHENRESREKRFTTMVHDIVNRGGRCLIPAFALGRAQELLLILDEYWQEHEELQDIPIYYASALAQKCMDVYQTFVSSMNKTFQQKAGVNNPFKFKHVSYLKGGFDQFDDSGPSVVLASPGMLQSGLSRQLFEAWCGDSKNGCIIAGYCVEGTLAKHILSEPDEVIALNGTRLQRRIEIGYISFSAHADFEQTKEFIKQMKPAHLILVHGEMHEMSRLKAGIQRQFEEDGVPINIHNPKNTERVEIDFHRARKAKIIGKLSTTAGDGNIIGGVIVERDFEYKIMDPSDLMQFSAIPVSKLQHSLAVPYAHSFKWLRYNIRQITDDFDAPSLEDFADELKGGDLVPMSAFGGAIKMEWWRYKGVLVLSWDGGVTNDMYSDALAAAISHANSNPVPENRIPDLDRLGKKEDLVMTALQNVCGKDAVLTREGDIISIEVEEKVAKVDMSTNEVTCEDPHLEHLLKSISRNISLCAHSTPPARDIKN
ncbi:unnamed protein product, partial [Mesorhabditis spiculigera]